MSSTTRPPGRPEPASPQPRIPPISSAPKAPPPDPCAPGPDPTGIGIASTMPRLYYYVVDNASGWTLSVGDDPNWHSPVDYRSRDEAVAVAAVLAHSEWKNNGRATGVRVRTASGDWQDERTFGRDHHASNATKSS